jgi:hypothetical protein
MLQLERAPEMVRRAWNTLQQIDLLVNQAHESFLRQESLSFKTSLFHNICSFTGVYRPEISERRIFPSFESIDPVFQNAFCIIWVINQPLGIVFGRIAQSGVTDEKRGKDQASSAQNAPGLPKAARPV